MFYSQAHNCVVYDHPNPGQVAAAIQGAKPLSASLVAVPATLFNMQLARVLGLPVPNMLDIAGYDWPAQPGIVPYAHQKHMAAFHVASPKAFNLSEMGCVDAETEYLSPAGWRRMDQYDGGKVAQYHLDGRAEFVQPAEYVKRPCAEMFRFKTTKGVDQKLSPEHRVLWIAPNGDVRVSSAESIAYEQERLARGWKGRFITTFDSPGGDGLSLTDAQLRLQVAVIADGHFNNATRVCVVRVKKERKKTRLRELLLGAGIPYRETAPEYENALGFSVFKFQAPRRDKVFNTYYWSATLEQLRLIADETVHWDGSERKDSAEGFYACEKESADFIQYCYASTGRTASLVEDVREGRRTCYAVHARKNPALLYLTGWTNAGCKTSPVAIEPTLDGLKYCFVVPTSFLVFRRNGCIFVSGNTGKTLAILWAADYLMRQGAIRKALILSPLSTLKRVWEDEIFRAFLDKRKAAILYGTRDERLTRLRKDVSFFIINHDGLGVGSHRNRQKLEIGPIAAQIRDREDIDLIVIDEASAYKDGTAQRTKILRQVLVNKPYVWELSGTPTPNAPTDAHSLARLLGNLPGESFQSFRGRTMMQVSQFKYVPRANSSEAVRKALSPAVRFSREECIDLPECVIETRDVDLSPTQDKAYKQLKKDLKVEIGAKDTQITAFNEASLRLKLLQIVSGAVYGPNREVVATDAGPRLKILKEVIDEAGAKLLIFASFTSVVNMLYTALKEEYGEQSVARVYGGTGQTARNEIFRAFEREAEPRIIVADPGTMAHGITLVAANTIVWWSPTDHPENYQQANARINRPGQKNKMLIVQLASTPIERDIYKRLSEKASLQGVVLKLAEEDR